ncbi:cytochrome P450 4g15-like [Culicoides brevitarsis]|uniref:cytochrome P450 4g15-like n=1 Tax=Culicoides brevitarsis TaxID=469753 RepID=UPI00307B740B
MSWILLWIVLNLKYLLALVILGIYIYWHWTRRELYIASWKLEGPFCWPFIGNLPSVIKHRKRIMNFADELTQCYKNPPRFWMGPFLMVYMSEPDDLQVVLNHTNALSKTFIYKFGHDYIGKSLLTIEGPKWRQRRKIMKPTFNIDILEGYISKFDRASDVLVERLATTKAKKVDAFNYVVRCTIDMISETAFDTTIDAQTERIGEDMMHAMHNVFGVLLKRTVRLWLYVDEIFKRTKLYENFMRSISIFHAYTDKVFDRKTREWQNRINESPESLNGSVNNFIDYLITNHLTSNNNVNYLAKDEIKREMDGMFAAGSDTTAHTISFILLLLAMFPEHQKAAREEVLELFQRLEDTKSTIKRHHLHDLPILDMIIQESLRLFPPTPFIARQLDGPVTLKSGIVLPKNTHIGVGIYSAHRNREVWGEDADKFRPERFSIENLQKIKNFSYSFIPFAAGERNCIGLKFARYSMKMMLMKILRDFEVETDEKFEEIECEVNVLAKKVNGWNVRFRKREKF